VNDLEHNLRSALQILSKATSKNTAMKQVAVRWFNRTYYDLARWNTQFVALLQTYPGFQPNPQKEELEAFEAKFLSLANQIDSRGYSRGDFVDYEGVPVFSSDICMRINFLGARLRKDFLWLREEDPKAYRELSRSVGAVIDGPGYTHGISSSLGELVRLLERQMTGRSWHQEKEEKPPTINEVKEAIENYIQYSEAVFKRVGSEARKIGFLLLSVTEYDDALQKEGSLNPNVIVIGEVAISQDTYTVEQAGAVGPHAHAHEMTFNETGIQIEKTMDLSQLASELSKLRQAMRIEATEMEHDMAVGDVAKAERAAEAKNPSKLVEHLRSAGSWALNVATKIGASLAVDAIKQASGMK
jgi:hypothetical protein